MPGKKSNPMREMRDSVERFVQEGVAVLQGAEALVVDIYETDTALVVKANVVGAVADEIDVTIKDDRLTIKGETKPDAEVDDGAYLRRERRFGKFERSFLFSHGVVAEEASASYKGGVLTVVLPKTAAERGQKIEIQEA
ncbi:MAG: Hsp20/alpha crystallin family protein [Anaerolineae bacterium]|nr:Hsp20/alpha crystallin family protein [Anaerolineae bacterium]